MSVDDGILRDFIIDHDVLPPNEFAVLKDVILTGSVQNLIDYVKRDNVKLYEVIEQICAILLAISSYEGIEASVREQQQVIYLVRFLFFALAEVGEIASYLLDINPYKARAFFFLAVAVEYTRDLAVLILYSYTSFFTEEIDLRESRQDNLYTNEQELRKMDKRSGSSIERSKKHDFAKQSRRLRKLNSKAVLAESKLYAVEYNYHVFPNEARNTILNELNSFKDGLNLMWKSYASIAQKFYNPKILQRNPWFPKLPCAHKSVTSTGNQAERLARSATTVTDLFRKVMSFLGKGLYNNVPTLALELMEEVFRETTLKRYDAAQNAELDEPLFPYLVQHNIDYTAFPFLTVFQFENRPFNMLDRSYIEEYFAGQPYRPSITFQEKGNFFIVKQLERSLYYFHESLAQGKRRYGSDATFIAT